MELVVLGIALAALAAVILTLVAPPMEGRKVARNDGSAGGADGWTPAMFGSDGGSDCSGADAGACGGDGGGGGGGD